MSGTAVLLEQYKTHKVIELLEKHKVSILIAVPAVIILLLEKFNKRFSNLKSLKKVGYAGAPMPVSTILHLKKSIPKLKCYNFYGLTETSSITTVLPDKYALKTPNSVGVPATGVRVKVVDKLGRKLKNDHVGELLIKGGNIAKGYLKNPKATRRNIINSWLHSGDMASIDEKNRVFLMGRFKELINSRGEKIYPILLENKLYNYSKILEVAVVGIPHKIFGESVRLCVVKKPRTKLTKQELLSYCKENFAEYEIPSEILFLKELPKNANGKIQKLLLKAI